MDNHSSFFTPQFELLCRPSRGTFLPALARQRLVAHSSLPALNPKAHQSSLAMFSNVLFYNVYLKSRSALRGASLSCRERFFLLIQGVV